MSYPENMNGDRTTLAEPLLNRSQIASIFDVSENTIDKWRQKGMPVETEGGNGRAYEFLFTDCKAWRDGEIARDAADKSAADKFVAQQRMEFLGVKVEDRQYGMTPAQMRDLSQAEFLWMKAASERRALVRVDEVSDLMGEIFVQIREGLDGFPDWLEREFSLDGDQVEIAVAYCDQVLKKMQEQIESAHLVEGVEVPPVGRLI
ncbi:DUF1441 family protein [Falsihalocynthiibacter sp. CO-5D18]|uniref:DUF1441 family protein n=1 Tax=Falsihalocynthiibacter sp. CO-5D18 TaxID=3240872 RepID=UPI003510888B